MKVCGNGCGRTIEWDKNNNFYREVDTKERHTYERCQSFIVTSLKSPAAKNGAVSSERNGDQIKEMHDRRVEAEQKQTEAILFLASTIEDTNKLLKLMIKLVADQYGRTVIFEQ